MPKSFLVDTSRCTACRGCQLACKEWHELPANATLQYGWGSHQNPQDLNPNNYKLVRFSEHLDGDVIRWNFFPDQCRHCVAPPCKDAADSIASGIILKDAKTGAVLFTEKSKQLTPEQFEDIRYACPYNIPRRSEQTKLMNKCTMCNDRVLSGMLPACVKACPTGTMRFGERDVMLKIAEERLAEVRKTFPNAMLADPEDVSVIFLLIDDPGNYHENAVADASGGVSRHQFLAGLAKPFSRLLRAVERG